MIKKLVFTVSLCTSLAHASRVGLKDLTSKLLENNFDIKLHDIIAQQKVASHLEEQGDLDINFNYEFSLDKDDTPSSSSLDGAGNSSSVKSDTLSHVITLKKKFSTGTELSIPYTYKTVDSNSSYRTIQKTYEPSIGIELTQPLITPFFGATIKKIL